MMPLKAIDLIVEVAGCPTVCHHCWAQGVPYRALPVDDVRWVLESVHGWCDRHAIRFGAFPMHEVAAHPNAAELIRLFAAHDWMPAPFQPLSTTGVPLAQRDDWLDVLRAAAGTGTTIVWPALHGLEEEHDRQVARRGAFAETCLAVERIHSAGLDVGCNVFVTRSNAHQSAALAEVLATLRVEEQSWEPAAFHPHARLRHHERLRPELADLRAFAETIGRSSDFYKDQWGDLESYTEGAWVRRALTGDWPVAPTAEVGELHLVMRPNMDLHFGRAGRYRKRYGNLRLDGVDRTLELVLADGARPIDEIWFEPDAMVPVPELALRFGDPDGLAIHFDHVSISYLWLDRAQKAGRASA